MKPLERPSPPPRVEMSIDTGRSRRWAGRVGYAVIYLAVCALLVVLFVRFTGSVRLAILLVAFLVAYMTLMGFWAERNLENRD